MPGFDLVIVSLWDVYLLMTDNNNNENRDMKLGNQFFNFFGLNSTAEVNHLENLHRVTFNILYNSGFYLNILMLNNQMNYSKYNSFQVTSIQFYSV